MSNLFLENIHPLVGDGTVTMKGNVAVTGSLTVTGTLHARMTDFVVNANSTTLGDASGDTIIINGSTVSIPNNLTFDTSTLHIDSSNNRVGIGTTSPGAPLHVSASATTSTQTVEILRLEVNDKGADMNVGHGPGIDFFVGETGGSDYGGTVAVVREQAADANTDCAMVFHTTTDDQVKDNSREKMRITSAGKVGIGTTSPNTELHVAGDATVDDDLFMGSDTAVINFGATADNITLGHRPSVGLVLTGSGDTTGLMINNTKADGDPFLAFGLSGTQTFTMGIDDGDSDKFKIGTSAIGTNTRLTIDSDGKVGIGTTAPTKTLGIDGDLHFQPTAITTAHITTAGSLKIRADNSLDIGDDGADAVKIGRTNTTAAKVHIRSGAANDLVVSNSKVGIGTDAPSAPAHVFLAATTSTAPAEVLRLEVNDGGVDMNIGHGPGIDFFIGETGGSDYGGTVAIVKEVAGDADTACAMVFHTTTDDQVKDNSREKMRITSAGKVGIGVTDPDSHLEVFSASTQLKLSYDADSSATLTVADGSGLTIASGESGDIVLDPGGNNVLPGSDSADSLGASGTAWATLFVDNIDLDGQGRIDLDTDQDTSIRASADDKITFELGGTDELHINSSAVFPAFNRGLDLGTTDLRFGNIFTQDLHLANDRGDWTVIEEEDYLSIRNNKNGKMYKFVLQEISEE